MVGRNRDIRESHRYVNACEKLHVSTRRLDEILDGVTWAIHRDAEGGIQPLNDLNVWFRVTEAFSSETPALRVWYRIDGDYVELLHIELVTDDEQP